MRMLFCTLLSLTMMSLREYAMELTIRTKDGGSTVVNAQRWHDFAVLAKSTADPVEASLATIARIDVFSRTPFDDILAQDFEVSFAQETCNLEPGKSSPLFHVLAQQAARANRRLFDKLIASPCDRKSITHELKKFLSSCPAPILPYLNCYFYLLFAAPVTTRTTDPKLWQGESFTTFITTTRYLAHLVGDLPTTKDSTLSTTMLEATKTGSCSRIINYIHYLLLLGANPNQMVDDPRACRNKCCECEYNVLIPSPTKKPLLTCCSDTELLHLLQAYLPTDNKT